MNILDQSALDNIRALQRPGSPDLLGRIVELFLTDAPLGVAKVQTAIAAADLETVSITAHSLKSSASYLGATAFSQRMAGLERAARDEDLAACQQLNQGLESDCQDVVDALLQLKDKAA